jgi:hypothetical protein
MTEAIDFVRGHCGWDVLTLVPEGQIAPDQELAAALKILDAPLQGGLEVGYLGRTERDKMISMRMVSSTHRDWIPMCGGMTQVVGKALVETSLRDYFGLQVSSDLLEVGLLTPSGEIPLTISVDDGRVTRVVTGMKNYVGQVYRDGVEDMEIDGVPLVRSGEFAVFNVADLEKRFPGFDFTDRRFGPALDQLHEVLAEFGRRTRWPGVSGMMFDDRADSGGQYRIYPRFLSDDLAAASCPWEFQCGTGSVAVAIALHRLGRIPKDARTELVFEWGNRHVTPDPYGVRLSHIEVVTGADQVIDASFSHSHIEILAEGKLCLPAYDEAGLPLAAN